MTNIFSVPTCKITELEFGYLATWAYSADINHGGLIRKTAMKMKKRGKTNKRQWGVVVEVVGWGKNKQRTPSTWSDAVCRRVQFPTPFWRVTYSFSIFVRLCSGAPSARPNCLLLLQEEEEEISFLFYFLPSSQSDRVQSCSRRIVVFNKSYSSFLISPRFFLNKNVMVIALVDTKKRKKKNFWRKLFFRLCRVRAPV